MCFEQEYSWILVGFVGADHQFRVVAHDLVHPNFTLPIRRRGLTISAAPWRDEWIEAPEHEPFLHELA